MFLSSSIAWGVISELFCCRKDKNSVAVGMMPALPESGCQRLRTQSQLVSWVFYAPFSAALSTRAIVCSVAMVRSAP